ncbi:hypothetical protein BFJ66_g15942 [Fusarium oxysporum f. sp. cepae]|nr:hypothetical protein BFJ66_g15942 [Fusarium oxysporum f. sp. cepae]
MAEALGVASSVIAVVDLSAKVISWCVRYAQDVSHAKEDKKRLAEELTRLNLASVNARNLLDGPHGSKLKASHALLLATVDSKSQLKRIERQLAEENGQGKVGFEALKWPFKSKDAQSAIQDLDRCTKAIYLALEVDQTSILLDIDHKIALDMLPAAEGASFDSHAEEHNPTCLPNTRKELLREIDSWIVNPSSKIIFWLNGMAGTGKSSFEIDRPIDLIDSINRFDFDFDRSIRAGSESIYTIDFEAWGKSTVSRTVARSRSKQGDLGASFFFKRGETDRGNLTKFVPTVARQLAWSIPGVAFFIKKALDANSAIVGDFVKEQFEKLIQEPLSKAAATATTPSSVVMVIDALDECDQEADIRLLINIFSQAKTLRPHLRVFLTSRPELPIRLGFSEVQGSYQDLVLHEIPAQIVEHDIVVFLNDEFKKIRHDFNMTVEDERKLPPDWPGRPTVQRLAQMAVPLFIFAATVCRFIGDRRRSPQSRLQSVLGHGKRGSRSQLDQTYAPILRSQITSLPKEEREEIIKDFRVIVGSIVTLASPLSVVALSCLIDAPPEVVGERLDALHSVLSIPLERTIPVRLLHLSFRDYLMTEESEFQVDERDTHQSLAKHCLRIMRGTLRRNICDLSFPGMRRSAVDLGQLEKSMPSQVQYACMHWAYHQTEGDSKPEDDKEVYDFLTTHFLHWLEAMSLLGRVKECLDVLRSLARWLETGEDSSLSTFVADAVRFVQAYFSVIAEAPLQTYCCLAFTPSKSVVRRAFKHAIPKWITSLPKVEENWNACLLTLEGHRGEVSLAVFSHDSKKVASASWDETIRIWDAETGECERVLEGHSHPVRSVMFSHDSKKVASASWDETIRIWNAETGECERVLEGHSHPVRSVMFSHDSKKVASASWDETIRIWNAGTGECERVLEGQSHPVRSVMFSHDSKKVASAS